MATSMAQYRASQYKAGGGGNSKGVNGNKKEKIGIISQVVHNITSGGVNPLGNILAGSIAKKVVDNNNLNNTSGAFRGADFCTGYNCGDNKTASLDNLSQALISAKGGYSGGSAGGSVGVSAQPTIDLTPILDSYKQSAEAQKGTLRGAYGSQRSQLLNSLKRFQEDTSLARSQQKEAFNANRADLESQAYMADRSAMQNAAARGLGGSGLQQLAQLQNQIKSGEGTSDLAKSNQTALEALTRALSNKDTDVTSAVNDLTSEEANKVNEIEKNTTNVQEDMKYNEAVRLQDAIERAQQANASIAAQSQSSANQYKDLIDSATSAFEGNQVSALNAIKNAFNSYTGTNKKKLNERNSAVKSAYDTALDNLTQQYAVTGLPTQYLNAYKSQLDDLLNQYYK